MSNVLIHCQPSMLQTIKELGLTWRYSPVHNEEEIDVIAPDIAYNSSHFIVDPDEQYCYLLGINYDEVNCIEAM